MSHRVHMVGYLNRAWFNCQFRLNEAWTSSIKRADLEIALRLHNKLTNSCADCAVRDWHARILERMRCTPRTQWHEMMEGAGGGKYAEPHRRTSGCFIMPWLTWVGSTFACQVCTGWGSPHRVATGRESSLTGRWIGKWGKWEAAHSSKGNSYLRCAVVCCYLSRLHSQGLLMAWFHIQCQKSGFFHLP